MYTQKQILDMYRKKRFYRRFISYNQEIKLRRDIKTLMSWILFSIVGIGLNKMLPYPATYTETELIQKGADLPRKIILVEKQKGGE